MAGYAGVQNIMSSVSVFRHSYGLITVFSRTHSMISTIHCVLRSPTDLLPLTRLLLHTTVVGTGPHPAVFFC